jgi:predicted membrane-bound mannosyltransferase
MRRFMSRRWLVLIVLIVLVGASLRVITLGHEAVDGDELFSRRVAVLPIHQMLPAIRADLVHPPFYYFLLKAGLSLWGSSALGIRLWSLLFGLLLIPLSVWQVGLAHFGGLIWPTPWDVEG